MASVQIQFLDRVGRSYRLPAVPGESIAAVLRRGMIPVTSVIILQDGHPVPETLRIREGEQYDVQLIEGYDIGAILGALARLDGQVDDAFSDRRQDDRGIFRHRSLGFAIDGSLETETTELSLAELSDDVERRVGATISRFGLIKPGERICIGLSGGVDSSVLLLVLAAARKVCRFEIDAVTFEDFDSAASPTFGHAQDLSARLGVKHHLVPASVVAEVFHLTKPLREILLNLMSTPTAHLVMYIDHHTTRRALEVFAQREGINTIALGLHTTDLLAGLINAWTTGYYVGTIPLRQVADFNYVYPLAFVSKRELHLYHLHNTGRLARHTTPNPWELFPQDRNFYYYLADRLQDLWPGLEHMMFTAHTWRTSREPAHRYTECHNCGSSILHQPFTPTLSDLCDVCVSLRDAGYIAS